MKNLSRVLICFLFVVSSCKKGKKVDEINTLPFFNSAIFTPEWIEKDSPVYKGIHTIADFSLVNQDGKEVTKSTYNNKIYIADFFFTTCPGICPILEKNMNKIQEKYREDDDIMLLSHTVMPVKDSVSVLKQYAIDNGIDSKKWNLVTGDKKQIYDLARKSYFADEDFIKTQDEDAFIHTENFVLIDKKGRIRGVYNGTLALDTERLIRHIEILKREG
ncbi:SCO family protein [Tenacibaculum sp. S7007]|uniref:SCO family protein n=1 Tax=Tenacibaculum pelagium TaxID=2759527 RepID=A0A839APJ1_9FLAO|nr:SCO family protein [Tenacibaculum pelagium]MBA6157002.1 SCO family protein [Tenacibaculum pelagium]